MIQGDQYSVPIDLTIDGEPPRLDTIETIEFSIGNIIKKYPGEVTYMPELATFLVPLTQEETFTFADKTRYYYQARVKFVDGSIIGTDKVDFFVGNSLSKEVL